MVEERITTIEPHDKAPYDGTPASTHTTIVYEAGARRRGGGAGWLIAIVLLIAVIAGLYLFSQTSASEAVKDNAIAEAAHDVGKAANQVGDAARDAAGAITN